MAKRKMLIEATYHIEVEIDLSDPIVQDYSSLDELADHLARYHFSTLPVIGKGVRVIDQMLYESTISYDN